MTKEETRQMYPLHGVKQIWQLWGAQVLLHLLSHMMKNAQVTEQHLAPARGDERCCCVQGSDLLPLLPSQEHRVRNLGSTIKAEIAP